MPYLIGVVLVALGLGVTYRSRLQRRIPLDYPLPEALIIQPQSELPLESRILRLEGGINFRDVGGYITQDGQRVKTGLVYRSGALGQLTDADWQQIQRLNLGMICDLRSDDEVQVEPDDPPFSIAYQHLGVEAEPPRFARLRALFFDHQQMIALLPHVYKSLLVDQNAANFGKTLRLIADPDNLPIVIHCTAGKDRTGVITGLLLMLLGVPDDVIAADYSLSNYYYDRFYEVAQIALKPLSVLGFRADDVAPLLSADAQTMQSVLDHVREKYGSIENYLTGAAGMTAEDLTQIRANLLE